MMRIFIFHNINNNNNSNINNSNNNNNSNTLKKMCSINIKISLLILLVALKFFKVFITLKNFQPVTVKLLIELYQISNLFLDLKKNKKNLHVS